MRYLALKKLIPDKLYLKIVYFKCFKKRLNLRSPETFNEKIQWLKLYDHNDKYIILVDKYEVKKYVSDRIGEEYIIPTLGVWDSYDQIDFKNLPNQFVLKCTHDSGGLVIVRDKKNLNHTNARFIINESLNRNYFYVCREWPYKNVKPRIIAEKYMVDDSANSTQNNLPQGLVDYKFYCFDGEPIYLYISKGLEDHNTARISFLNLDWTFAPFNRTDYRSFETLPPKPHNYNEMISIAKKLSSGFNFVRVDLYEINNKVYFSELTLHPCGGFMPFYPEEYDKKLGTLLNL